MGKFLDKIADRRNSAEALAHRIALRLSTKEFSALITEAGDDSFSYSVIATRLKIAKKFEFFEAHGRSNVVKTLNMLINMGKKDRSYAIIDRDFNFDAPTIFLDGHCFITDRYSFENYLAETELLEIVGHRFFSLEPGSDHSTRWSQALSRFLTDISTLLALEHSSAVWCKRQKISCNLGNFRIGNSIASCESGVLTRSPTTYSNFISDTKADISAMQAEEHIAIQEEVSEKGWKVYFRGHYFWELFVKFLNKFRSVIDEELRVLGRSRARTRQEISERHAFEASIALMAIPASLEAFFLSIA